MSSPPQLESGMEEEPAEPAVLPPQLDSLMEEPAEPAVLPPPAEPAEPAVLPTTLQFFPAGPVNQTQLPFKRFVRHNSQALEIAAQPAGSIVSCYRCETCNFTCKNAQGLAGHKTSVLHKARVEMQLKRLPSRDSQDSSESPEKKAAIASLLTNLKPLISVHLICISLDPKGATLRFWRAPAPPES